MSASANNSHLLAIGRQCSYPSCNLVDFLPFKCHHCEHNFCQEHFKVAAHNCTKYDETKHNRVAPNCPLCNVPVAVRLGQDPNIRMDEHIDTECLVTTGKDGKSNTLPVCAKPNCKKILFSPIRCDKCRDQFCPSHRFSSDHGCSPRPDPPSRPRLAHLFNNINTKNLDASATAARPATLGVIKKSMTAPTDSPSVPKPSAPTLTPPSMSSHTKIFSKTDSPSSSFPANFPHNGSIKFNNDTRHPNAVSTIFNYNSFVPRSVFATA